MFPGIIGKKIGMSQIFQEDGKVEAVTAVEAGPCCVVQVKTKDREGYNAVQLGFGEAKRCALMMPLGDIFAQVPEVS